MSPYNIVLCVALLLLALHGIEGRGLGRNRTRKHAGVKRTFKADGGAAAYLKQLDADEPQKLSRIMRQSRVEKLAVPALAQMLDEDADLVSKSSIFRATSAVLVVNAVVTS